MVQERMREALMCLSPWSCEDWRSPVPWLGQDCQLLPFCNLKIFRLWHFTSRSFISILYCMYTTCNTARTKPRKQGEWVFDCYIIYMYFTSYVQCSLVPRPSHHPVFDHLQYAKTEEGLIHFYHVKDVSVYTEKEWALRPYVSCSFCSKHWSFECSQSKKMYHS